MTDYRALCAELVALNDERTDDAMEWCSRWNALMDHARAALTQPEPVGPTDEELQELLYYGFTTSTGHGHSTDEIGFARAVLARYARPAIEPVPVSERLPGAQDCDAEGRCWFWEHMDDRWVLMHREVAQPDWPWIWLPFHALPLPGQPAPTAPAP